MFIVASRDWIYDPVSASEADPRPATTTSNKFSRAESAMTPDVVASVASLVPTIVLSDRYSTRISRAWGAAFAIVAPIELMGLGPLLGTWHPLRWGIPLVMGTLALYESHAQRASWGAVPRGYVMALLTFALAGVYGAALFFHALQGAWIVPGFTIVGSVMIWTVALIPKGRVPWLQS